MKIILDERETTLYEKCKMQNTSSNVTLIKRVMPLGDVLITTDTDKDVLLIERKSLADLLSSIKDGRYEEQSYRLMHSDGLPQPHHIIYVIEGIISQLRTPIEKKMVYSAMTSLNVFKGFSVIRTSSIQETADWILATADKLGRELTQGNLPWSMTPPMNGINNNEEIGSSQVISQDENAVVQVIPSVGLSNPQTVQNYCSVVKKVKKDNITPENMGEIILCQIPGISSVSAMAIMQRFKSISHLMNELTNNPNCLDGFECTSKEKTRKLSKTIIQNIKTYLLYKSSTDGSEQTHSNNVVGG